MLKKAMGLKVDKDLKTGVTSQDVLLFLKEVVRMNVEIGKEVKFVWKREGRNHSVSGKGWSGKDCKRTFSQIGTYVVLGKTKMNNDLHGKRMKKLCDKDMSDLSREEYYASYALGKSKLDHAISISVEDDGRSQLIDNGCKTKEYNITNLASRMDDVRNCYKMELYYV